MSDDLVVLFASGYSVRLGGGPFLYYRAGLQYDDSREAFARKWGLGEDDSVVGHYFIDREKGLEPDPLHGSSLDPWRRFPRRQPQPFDRSLYEQRPDPPERCSREGVGGRCVQVEGHRTGHGPFA